MVAIKEKIVTGSFLRVMLFFLTAVTNIFITPLIIHSLGNKSYGLWVLVGTFLGYYGLLDLGLNFAVKRFVSRGIGANDPEEINAIVNTSFVALSIIGFLAMLLAVTIGVFVPVIIKNISEPALFRNVLVLMGINLALGFPFSVFSGLLTANLRYDIATLIDLGKLILRTFLLIIVLHGGYGIMALAIATVSVDFLGYILSFLFAKKVLLDLSFSIKFVTWKCFRQIFSYSSITFIAKIADQLRFNIDNLVIVTYLGLHYIAIYSIGFRLIQYFYEFLESALGITLPVFSRFEGANDFESIRNKYLFWTKISTFLSVSVGTVLIVLGKVFIIRWVGLEYKASYDILLILLFPCMMEMFQPTRGVLFGLSKHKFFTISTCVEGLINLILSIYFVKRFGLIGIALGTAIPMFINQVLIQPLFTCKVIKLGFSDLYFKVIGPTLLLIGGTAIIFNFTFRRYFTPSYLNILILMFVLLLTETAVFFFYVLRSDEKIMFKGILQNLLKPCYAGKKS